MDESTIQSARDSDLQELAESYIKFSRRYKSPLGGDELYGPCPRCGGTDRFHVATGINRFTCRECLGMERWYDPIVFIHWVKTGKVEVAGSDFVRAIEELAGKQLPPAPLVRAERDPQERIKRLQEFRTDELWEELHRRMTAEARDWWESQGINDAWQQYWKLGYTPDKPFYYHDALLHSPAYSIPYRDLAGEPVNLQWRLANPPDERDKYRWFGGLGSSYFVAHPKMGLTDEVFVTEGAKKGMNLAKNWIHHHQVLAVPSKNDWAGLPETVRGVGRVWVILDPDGEVEGRKLCALVGENARLVTLHAKLDDLILGGMEYDHFQAALRYARPVVNTLSHP